MQCEVDKDHIKEKEHYKVEKYEKVDDEFDFMSYDYTHKEKEHTNKYRKDDGRRTIVILFGLRN